jgi:hypothetical protein
MIAEIQSKQKLAISNVYVGGGGNIEGDSRKMSLKWIRGLVEDMITNEKWNVAEVAWEEVNNS